MSLTFSRLCRAKTHLAVAAALAVVFTLQTLEAREALPQRLTSAIRLTQAPVIDGKLDEHCWRSLQPTNQFTCVLTRNGNADAQTRARIGYDDKNLYFGIHCDEPRMNEAVRIVSSREHGYDESIEVFVDADLDRHTYRQFRVALDGQADHHLGSQSVEGHDGWQSGIARAPDGWTVEIAISWNLLAQKPVEGLRMGLNVNRLRSNVIPAEFSCWSNTHGGFHAPSRFGNVVLGDYGTWLRQYLSNGLGTLLEQSKAFLKQYPESTQGVREPVAKLASFVEASERQDRQIQTEDAALAAFSLTLDEIAHARNIQDAIRLAVIEGEFR